MKFVADCFHPAATELHLTRNEVVEIAKNLKDSDTSVVLRYMDMDYATPAVEYHGQLVEIGGILQPNDHRVIRIG